MQRSSAPDSRGPPGGSDGHSGPHVTTPGRPPPPSARDHPSWVDSGGRRLPAGTQLPSPLRQAPPSPRPRSPVSALGRRPGSRKLASEPGVSEGAWSAPKRQSRHLVGAKGFRNHPTELCRPGPGSGFSSHASPLLPTPSVERRQGLYLFRGARALPTWSASSQAQRGHTGKVGVQFSERLLTIFIL